MIWDNIQGAGSMGGIGTFARPPASRPLIDEQKSSVESTLFEFDAESLAAGEAMEILATFRENGIHLARICARARERALDG